MLVLSRKLGQSIVVGDKIVVNVVAIGRGRVQLGITAPPHLAIHRNEIHARIKQEAAAVQTRNDTLEVGSMLLAEAGTCV